MKKHSVVVLMLALALVVAPVAAQGKVDLVVLLDSSKSMFQYYNQVVDYVLTETVRDYLRFGDSFHLLSFSDSTQLEIAQVLRTEPDIRSVIARLYLLYPLGRNTDLVTALRNVYQYVDDLPSESTKHIILITDGMHSPAPGTPYATLDVPAVRDEIDRAAVRIRERGWTMRIVRVPFTTGAAPATIPNSTVTPEAPGTNGAISPTGATGPGGMERPGESADTSGEAAPSAPGSGDYLADVAAAVGQEIRTFDPENASASLDDSVELPRIAFPGELGIKDYSFSLPIEISNGSKMPLSLELTGLFLEDGTNILSENLFAVLAPGRKVQLTLKVRLPDTIPAGPANLSLEPRFANGLRVSPARSAATVTLKRSAVSTFFKSSGGFALFLTLLLITCVTVLVLLLYIRRAHRKTEEPIVDALLDSATPAYPAQGTDRSRQTTSTSLAAPMRHTSPYASDTAAVARTGTPELLRQVAAPSRDSAVHQATRLAEATASASAARRRLAALNGTPSHRHTVAEQILVKSGHETSETARAASLLGTWKKPGFTRKNLPLRSEGLSRKSEISRQAAMHYTPRVSRPGAVRLILHVKDQNPNIGKRNIRAMHAGGQASVGGGRSAFLIFLFPVPRHLANLHYDGVDATLVPVKPEFFPDYNSPIELCIGRDIRLVTSKGKELTIRFERYVAPLDKINTLLHCLETPGLIMARKDAVPGQERLADQD